MVEAKAEICYPGVVPTALAQAFARLGETESNPPQNKRRKVTSGPQNLRSAGSISESQVPPGYIPLARFYLDLKFARADLSKDQWNGNESSLYLPILIKAARRPYSRKEKIQYDGFDLELTFLPHREIVFAVDSSDPAVIEFGGNLESASRLISADRYHKNPPTVCYQSTLQLLDRSHFRLETLILWKDSLDIIDDNRLPYATSDVFSKYVPRKEKDDDCGPLGQKNASGSGYWSPRDFYDSVHVPLDTPYLSAPVRCDLVKCELFPFQTRAVRWLLAREGKELGQDGKVTLLKESVGHKWPESFQQILDIDGKVCFVSHLYRIVTRDLSNWYDVEKHLKGGILAEEMGLGKTVEMISLICLNRRALLPEESFVSKNTGGLRPSGATLIITPPVILEQWKQEIESHAPDLRVFHYTGIQRHQELSDRELMEIMADNDVVLTTYNVLGREVHYSGDAPKRNLRHEKRFEPRKTPLVQISWWRVCLDEAQMIESGVSNAAKVARLIPRQMAWAVTGTPIRKDITDLLGLLFFLHYEPFCGFIWRRLLRSEFRPVLSRIVNTIALRHSKDRIRGELHLPPQKRVVITIPFTAVEEQRYRQLYEEMCEDCGLDVSGAPLHEDWNPDDQSVIEKMRSWLVRLRQICLHPAGTRRRGFGAVGPLRSVAEVLEVMVDENDTLIHTEERSLLLSQLRRGQLLENARRRQQSLDIWKTSLEHATEIVQQCRDRLQAERKKSRGLAANGEQGPDSTNTISDNEGEEIDKNPRVGTFRQRLRAALEVQHICVFFTGNAYYQIKTDPGLTEPESEDFLYLAKREEEAYAKAKLIRQEMLAEISQKAERFMRTIRQRNRMKQFVQIPKLKPQLYTKGLESRRIFDKLEDFCAAMNQHAIQYDEWRQTMIKFLSQSLIDQEDESELEGDEYEKSTKHQDEMYVYMEALRAMFADRHDALTGQKNVLIAHEVKSGIVQAQKSEGPSPKLFLEIMNTRSKIKPGPELGSLRGIITELRSLGTTLEWQSEGSPRARAELELVTLVLKHTGHMATEQTKVASSLEKEVELFRDTMNHRLEYYRQLQQISDTVAPYDEESAGKPLDENLFNTKLKQEEEIDEKISSLKAKRRYLIHLRDESGSDDTAKICIICQSGFEIGVLTVCGHKYCKDCLRMWWRQHRTCPICKKRLKANDFYQITYNPQEFVVQEERVSSKIEFERPSNNGIYTDISSGTLHEIKNIDLDTSFGTKIDTLARHVLWLREHDPGAQSIVFSQYKTFLDILGTAFSRFKIGYSRVDSPDGIQNFKSDPAIECFLLHAKAHSSGLNLVNATHVFLCEPLINTAIELQAIARVHRIGQHRPTTVWMYLVSDTVEQSIYSISVSRRLAHIVQHEKEIQAGSSKDPSNGINGDCGVVDNLTEAAIDSANSLEMQDAALTKLMAGGASGGELVKKDDLWQCLFGNPRREDGRVSSGDAGGEVARFLRAEAAEQRKVQAAASSKYMN